MDWKKEMKEDIEEISHLKSVARLLRLLDICNGGGTCALGFSVVEQRVPLEFHLLSVFTPRSVPKDYLLNCTWFPRQRC